jgi:acyl carrier protein
MTNDQIRTSVLAALASIAPEADMSTLDPRRSLREQLDLDSMDFLNFVVALHKALGVDVPERDYAKLDALEPGIEYLARRAAEVR